MDGWRYCGDLCQIFKSKRGVVFELLLLKGRHTNKQTGMIAIPKKIQKEASLITKGTLHKVTRPSRGASGERNNPDSFIVPGTLKHVTEGCTDVYWRTN